MNIGKSIRVGLAQRDKSQMQLASFMEVSEVTASRWKTGKATPYLLHLPKLAGFFGVPVSQFIEWGE